MESNRKSLIGNKIRSFRVVELLGRGGMGEVYVGFDEILERRVALKSIRQEHRLDPETRARFLREARMLSQLEHPNICQIFDYIEGDEYDLIVLELISGKSLNDAAKGGMASSVKMKIAEQLAEVLTIAHGKGIIHRDLKPDNVMLTAESSAKVLDFGLARSLPEETAVVMANEEMVPEPPLVGADVFDDGMTIGSGQPSSAAASRASTVATRCGTIMGTPGYMSPEQARGEPATAASDIYSLGVIFQELFTGRPAYPKTSGLIQCLLQVQQAATVPISGIDPDLCALIERMTSAAPGARPSAVDVAERLVWIRTKPRRRRRTMLRWAAVIVVALFSVAMTVQSIRVARAAERVNQEAARANREAAVAGQVSDFLIKLFEVSDPGEARGNTITARELLDAGAARVEHELRDQPLIQARLMQTMGDVYRQLGLYQPASPLLEQAVALSEQELGNDDLVVADCEVSLALLRFKQGEYERTEKLLQRARTTIESRYGPSHSEVAAVLNNLANLYQEQGRLDEAEPLYRQVLTIREQALGADHTDVAATLNNLAALYLTRQELALSRPLYERALVIWEQAYGEDHPDVSLALNNLASIYRAEGDVEASRKMYKRALAIRERTLGSNHPDVAQTLYNLGQLLLVENRHAEAEPLFTRSLAILEEAVGANHPFVAYPLTGLALSYAGMAKWDDALACFERALSLREQAYPDNHPLIVEMLTPYADTLEAAGRIEQAVRLRARVEQTMTEAEGEVES